MRARQEGYVLISVLWVAALLTVITLSYHHRSRLDVQAARYALDASQCRMAARGAVERGIVEIRNKQVNDVIASLNAAAEVLPATYLGQPWARPRDLYQEEGLLAPGEGFEEDVAALKIEDAERYININTAPEAVLENLPGMSRTVMRRINFQRRGIDDAGERTDTGPVSFHDPAELRYFRGIDDGDWFGEGEAPGLRDVVTTFGDGRVNINTAPLAVLQLLPELGEQGARDILAWRSGADGESGTEDDHGFATWEDFEAATQVTGDALGKLKQHCKFNSDYFRITAVVTRRSGRIRASCTAVVYIPRGADAANLVSWTENSLGS